jgi:predicted PurR-regulated permease PerM
MNQFRPVQDDTAAGWSPLTRIVIVIVGLLLAGLFIYMIRPLIGPIIIAALLAYAFNPAVKHLKSRSRMRHNTAVTLVYLLFLVLLIATPGILVPILVGQIRTLSTELAIIEAQLEAYLADPVVIMGRVIYLDQLWHYFLGVATESLTPATEDAIQVLEATSISLVWLILILVCTYYFLLDWKGLRNWLIALAPEKEQRDMQRLLSEIDSTWRAYLRGTLVLMLIMAVVFIIIGLAIGLPGAVALGLLTGLLSMVPELGPAVAGVLSVLVALFEGSNYLPISNFWFAVLVGIIYLVVMQIKSLWLRPVVMGRFMHMNTGLVFVAIIGAAILQGVLAALIILPILATVGIIGYYVRCKLLNLEPWPDSEVVLATATHVEHSQTPLIEVIPQKAGHDT